jgi:hypothetical protein
MSPLSPQIDKATAEVSSTCALRAVVLCAVALAAPVIFLGAERIITRSSSSAAGDLVASIVTPIGTTAYSDTGPFDLTTFGEPAPEVSAGGATASRAALRSAAAVCNRSSLYDQIQMAPPLRACSSQELSTAISQARRNGAGDRARGAPLIISGCRLEWYIGNRVCDLLEAVGGLDLNGDSLIRHLLSTLRALAIGDLYDGYTRHLESDAHMCICDFSYDDRHNTASGDHSPVCRLRALATLTLDEIRKYWPQYCSHWNSTDFLPPSDGWPPSQESRLPLMLIEGGLQGPTGLDQATLDLVFYHHKGARKYIFATQWAPGENKPAEYLARQGDEAVRRYNELMRPHAARFNATIFDAYAVTKNTPSFDGTHYLQSTNVELAQVLLNLVAAMHRDGIVPVAANS